LSSDEASAVRALIGKFDQAEEEAKKTQEQTAEFSPEEREFVREELTYIAEFVRKKHPEMSVPQVRALIREMLYVTV